MEKRARVEDELVNAEDLEAVERAEKLAHAKKHKQEGHGKTFAIVRGKTTGLFSSWEDMKHLVNKEVVYKGFHCHADALAWFERSLRLPLLTTAGAAKICVSGMCYDVTQDRDVFAGYAIFFGDKDTRNVCRPAPRGPYTAHHAFLRALEIAPKDIPLTIYVDSKHLVFGHNYGLKQWPAHVLDNPANDEAALWNRIQSAISVRPCAVAVEFCDDHRKNPARGMAIGVCNAQHGGGTPSYYDALGIAQCIAWGMCARRIGVCLVNKDVRTKISRLIWKNRHCQKNRDLFY